jgi:predicted enzyme related to lactoylglutathione lyase
MTIMPPVDAHQPGTPSWLELSTIDTAAARTFYQTLLGWSYFESPMGPDLPPYILARVQDRDVAAIFSMMKEQREQGMPPFWLVYFAVANVDQIVPKVTALGGTVMNGPFDVPEAGRMAVCADPIGGHFALWQAGKHPGARLVNEAGAMCWVELLARDVSKSEKFYTGLFGWSSEKMNMGGPVDYTVFKNGEISVAGMLPNPAGAEDNVPQNWLGYFQVTDCDGTTDKAKANGGQVFVSPQTVPTVGRFAVLADAQGATFGILQAEARK